MCDQSEVLYNPKDVVWVKLGPVWWPGVVAEKEEIPPEILKTLRKTPIAIVKFFQETEFEYVHKLSNIYHYNCLKKTDFIRKGLDLYRSKNKDAHKNMKLFPEDVARAEVLTGGDPNILNDKIFQPEEKAAYTDIFASTKKSPKKIKNDIKKKSSTQLEVQQPSAPRIITHPRFIRLSSGMKTDYEVRERKQEPLRAECDEEDNSPPTTYRCQDCEFTTIRLNVIVLHNKSHTRNYAKPTPTKTPKRKNISVIRVKERASTSERKSHQSAESVKPKLSETNGVAVRKTGKKGRPKKNTASVDINTSTKDTELKRNSQLSVVAAKPRRSSPQKDEFQESLLEDWAEFETEQEGVENGDTSFSSSIADTTPEICPTETKPTVENLSAKNKKDEFDFDDSEEQLVIDKSKIRAGRKIPRVLEKKSEEVTNSDKTEGIKKRKISDSGARVKSEENEDTEIPRVPGTKPSEVTTNETEGVRKRKMSATREKLEEIKKERKKSCEIPKVLEKSLDLKNNDTEDVKKRRMSGIRGKADEIKEDSEELKKSTESDNVRKRRKSETRRRSSVETSTKIREEKRKKSVESMMNVKKRKISETQVTLEGKNEEANIVVSETEKEKNENNEKKKLEKIEEITPLEQIQRIIEEPPTRVEIEERQEEIEVHTGEIEIEIAEQTVENDDDEPSMDLATTIEVPTSPMNDAGNDFKEKETAELSQKVNQLLQEVSVPSKLPELPRSLKKEHIKSYNASLTKRSAEKNDDNEDQIIESISLINDDSSDGFEADKESNSTTVSEIAIEKKRSTTETQLNSPSKPTMIEAIENVEVMSTSDSSPEIVSVEMPVSSRVGGSAKRTLTNLGSSTAVPTTTASAPKRPPVRFTMMSRFKNINSNQLVNRKSLPGAAVNRMPAVSGGRMLKSSQPVLIRPAPNVNQQLALQQSRTRSLLRQVRPLDRKNVVRVTTASPQVVANSTPTKMNQFILVKPTPAQRPPTIDNIDLTGPRQRRIAPSPLAASKPVRPTSNLLSKSLKGIMAVSKIPSKNLVLGSKTVPTTIELVSNRGSPVLPVQNPSEIITVADDIECADVNDQTEEMNYIVDEAGNVIAENACTSSKKEDILAKALQDTDVLPTDVTPTDVGLETCGIVRNTPSLTTVYENVTLNTPPIMSSFETPPRTISANAISEISEYIIISDTADI